MPRLALALAVGVMLSAPRPISARMDWDALSPLYIKSLVVILSTLDTTRDHFLFVKKEDIDLKVIMPGDRMQATTLGLYVDRENSMFLNRSMLLKGAEELRRKGTPDSVIPEILAWKTIHIVVHEIRHGMNSQGLIAKKGVYFPLTYIEDEYIAFIDQMATIHEVLVVRPELWEIERILDIEKNVAVLIEAQQRSVDGLKALVRAQPRYAQKPAVLSGNAGILADVRRREEEFEELLRGHLRAIRREYPDPAEFAEHRKDALEQYAPTLEDLRLGREFLEDSRKYKALRSFVRRELKYVVQKLEARRSR